MFTGNLGMIDKKHASFQRKKREEEKAFILH